MIHNVWLFLLQTVTFTREFQASLLKESDGVVTGRLAGSTFDSYNSPDTNESKILANIFNVPPCRLRRDVISTVENMASSLLGGNWATLPSDNLTTGYVVGAEKSNVQEVLKTDKPIVFLYIKIYVYG
uniref:Uncharacterized protein n=1 Tax=Oncorhynchus kisutch TaxID=8019 RepID=A0A8C7FPY9_ONCKI